MGLAFFLDRFGGHRCGHDGNNPGFAPSLLIAPTTASESSC
jgi:hypothetical protein